MREITDESYKVENSNIIGLGAKRKEENKTKHEAPPHLLGGRFTRLETSILCLTFYLRHASGLRFPWTGPNSSKHSSQPLYPHSCCVEQQTEHVRQNFPSQSDRSWRTLHSSLAEQLLHQSDLTFGLICVSRRKCHIENVRKQLQPLT